jgi:hypothetical protein
LLNACSTARPLLRRSLRCQHPLERQAHLDARASRRQAQHRPLSAEGARALAHRRKPMRLQCAQPLDRYADSIVLESHH